MLSKLIHSLATIFTPKGWCIVGMLTLVVVFLEPVDAALKDPYVRINAVGLWLKFWYGEGVWDWIRFAAAGVGLVICWLLLKVWDHYDELERKRLRKEWKRRHGI